MDNRKEKVKQWTEVVLPLTAPLRYGGEVRI